MRRVSNHEGGAGQEGPSRPKGRERFLVLRDGPAGLLRMRKLQRPVPDPSR